MLFNYFQSYANPAETATDVQSNAADSAKSVKNSVTFARSSVERHANIKAATSSGRIHFWILDDVTNNGVSWLQRGNLLITLIRAQ